MWDRYDPRDQGRVRSESWDRSFGSHGGSSDRDGSDGDPRDVFTKDLASRADASVVPSVSATASTRSTSPSRLLGTVGAFRVVAESDVHDVRD